MINSQTNNRLKKIKIDNMNSNKTYPPFVTKTFLEREPINNINFDIIKNDVIPLKLKSSIKSPPIYYCNSATNQYFMMYLGCNYVFDVSEEYNWEKVLNEGIYPFEQFRIKKTDHYKIIESEKKYYPGTIEYDDEYPPINYGGNK